MKRLFCLVMLFYPFLGSGQCWKRQFPATPTELLHQMVFTSPLDGVVVGNGGTILRSTDSGSTWTSIEVATPKDLFAVTFSDSATGWAGGKEGALLKSTTAGFTWQPQTFVDSISIRSLSFKNADTGFLCGDSVLYRTYNGGSSWTKVTLANASGLNFFYIKAFLNSDTVVAYNTSGHVYYSINNGLNWSLKSSGMSFLKVGFATPKIGYGVQVGAQINDKYYKTIDGGLNWVLLYTTGGKTASPYGSIQILDADRIFVLQPGGTGVNELYATTDGGQTWTGSQNSGLYYPNCLFFTSSKNGCIGDIYGGIFKTKNSGASFKRVEDTAQTQSTVNTYSRTNAIAFSDSVHGISTGSKLTMRTSDGGIHWIAGGNLFSSSISLKAYMSDSVTGWVIDNDGYLFRTQNGGQTYSHVASNCTDVRFMNGSFGMLAGSNGLWRTVNAGTTWTNVYNLTTNNNFTAVAYGDSLNWYATSSSYNIYKSTDGGLTWAKVINSGVSTYENTLLAFPNGRLYNASFSSVDRSLNSGFTWTDKGPANYVLSNAAISFADSLNGISFSRPSYTNFYNPLIYKTNNGGNNWQQLFIKTGSTLAAITFPDPMHIWACTKYGSIFRYYGVCPATPPLIPFTDRSSIVACANAFQSIKIVNYNLYTAGDTLSAVLKQGATVLQILAVSNTGKLTFTTPPNPGDYTVVVTVKNAAYPTGLTRNIKVKVIPPATPYLSYWHSVISNPSCSSVYYTIGTNGSNSLGEGYTLELHMIKKNGTDSLINSRIDQTNFPNLTDSCQLYYKVYLGEGLCYNSTLYYTDTIKVNIVQPVVSAAHVAITSNIKAVFCQNDSIMVLAQAPGVKPGSIYTFRGISGSVNQLLQTGTDSALTLSSLMATTKIYVQVQASANSCVTVGTFTSDTLTLTVAPPAGLVVQMATNKPQNTVCAGDSLVFKANANLPASVKQFDFHVISSTGTDALVQSGLDSQWAIVATVPQKVYVVAHIPALPCSKAISDTVALVVNPIPVQPVITSSGTVLSATPSLPGVAYQWYLAGNLLPGTTDTLHVLAGGSYTVKYSLLGCTAPLSPPFIYVPSSVEKAPFSSFFRVYPNPVTNTLWVESSRTIVRMVLSTLEGKILSEMHLEAGARKMQISTQGLPNGIYLLRAMGSAGEQHRQLVTKVAE